MADEARVRWWLGAMLLFALALRLGWGILQPVDDEAIDRLPDQREYLALGRSLLKGEGLRFYDERFGQHVHAYRTPGYPAFIALCGGSVRGVRAAQAVVDVSTVLAVFLLGRRWLSAGWSTVAAGMAVVNPFLIYLSGLILTETLFAAMMAWGLLLLTGPVERSIFRRFHASPLFWGLVILAASVLVRPSGIALPLVLGVGAVWVNWRVGGAYQRVGPAAIARRRRDDGRSGVAAATVVGCIGVLLVILCLLPWAVRNHLVLGRWVWTTTNGGITRYDGFNPRATGASNQWFVAEMPQLKQMNEAERDEFFTALADQFIRENPLRAIELAGLKIGRTWSPVPLSQEYGTNRLYVAAGFAYSVPLFVLVLVGLAGGRLPRTVKVLVLLPAIYLTAVHAVSVGSLRYRIPAEPPMILLAAAGVAVVASRAGRHGGRRGQ